MNRFLALPDIRERVDLYKTHQGLAIEQIRRCTRMDGTLAILDLRGEETIYASNRFMVYALFPQASISCHVMWGRAKQNTVLAFGKSIFDRSNPTNVGELMLEHGGGGHHAAGTCQVGNDVADSVLATLAQRINGNSAPSRPEAHPTLPNSSTRIALMRVLFFARCLANEWVSVLMPGRQTSRTRPSHAKPDDPA